MEITLAGASSSSSMAAGLSTALTFKPLHRAFSSSSNLRLHHPTSLTGLPSSLLRFRGLSVCYVVSDRRQSFPIDNDESPEKTSSLDTNAIDAEYLALRLAEKLEKKKSERFTYLIAAVMSSFGITSMAIMAVYYRFSWQMEVIRFFEILFFFFVIRSGSDNFTKFYGCNKKQTGR